MERIKSSGAIIRRNRKNAYLFLLPNILGFAVFTLIPVVWALVLSFMDWDGSNPATFVGLDNFIKLASDTSFRIALVNTFIYTFGTVPVIIVISLTLSVIIDSKIAGATAIRAAHFFPHISSIVALAVVWQFLYNPKEGPINMALSMVNTFDPPAWLSDKDWALFAIMIMIIWKSVGYYMIIYLAGLKGIPSSLYEAAFVDGANRWQRFWHITVPQLRPVTFYISIICIINSFQVFTPIYVMTKGGPGRATTVLVFQIYKEAFENYKFGYASASSMVLFLCILVVTLIQFRGQKKFGY